MRSAILFLKLIYYWICLCPDQRGKVARQLRAARAA